MGMVEQVKSKYVNEKAQDDISVGWNALQLDFECCAVANYLDYKDSNYEKDSGNPVPESCCLTWANGTANAKLCREEADGKEPTCEGPVDPKERVRTQLHACGCYSRVSSVMSGLMEGLIGGVLILAVLEVLMIFCACRLKQKLD